MATLPLLNHLIAEAWRASRYETPIFEIIWKLALSTRSIAPIVESWESLATLRRALGSDLDPWLDRAVEIAADQRYRCCDETATFDASYWVSHSRVIVYDASNPILALPSEASRYVGEKAPHIGGEGDALLAANARALADRFEDRIHLAFRYAFGGEDYAANLGADEDGSYDTARAILETIRALDAYPCVDEEVFSEVENERRAEALDDYLREELRSAALKSCEHRAEFVDGRVEEIDAIVDEHAWRAMDECSADDIYVDKRAIGALAKALDEAGLLIWDES